MKTRSFVPALAALACASVSFAHGQRPIPPGGAPGGDANWANQHLGHWRPDQPDFGFEFATIGNPGNRAVAQHEMLGVVPDFTGTFTSFGRVDYTYRISTTEVTASQWLPFAQAFRPFYESDGFNFFTSNLNTDHMRLRGFNDIEVIPGEERMAIRTQMMFAMRYANWLHHGAPTGPDVAREVFETGAYDLGRQYTFDAPPQRNEDARFWIPSWDEWTKAAYYDPNRYGEGQEGYWTYPDSPGTPPTFGPPGQGDWGYAPDAPYSEQLTVGRFPDTQSPWGLLDIAGTAYEWVETPWGVQDTTHGVGVEGRTAVGITFSFPALIDEWEMHSEVGGTYAFRLATIVPGPSAAGILAVFATSVFRRSRRAG